MTIFVTDCRKFSRTKLIQDYWSYLRAKPCWYCGDGPPSEVMHISWVDGTRMGGKAGPLFVLPGCRRCHDRDHAGKADSSDEYRMRQTQAMLRFIADFVARFIETDDRIIDDDDISG